MQLEIEMKPDSLSDYDVKRESLGQVIFDCEKCEHKTTQLGNLKSHILAKHEGVKYFCDQCNHRSSRKHQLKMHKATAHGGLKFQCESCDI